MPTRAVLRKQLARDLGAYGPLPTGVDGLATSASTTTITQATWPVKSSIAKTDEYSGWYLLRPNAFTDSDRVRQIPAGGYEPTTGVFTVDTAYTLAMTDGTHPDSPLNYELHGHGFHPWEGIDELLNEGLKLIYLPVQVPFIPYVTTSGNHIQNLTSGESTGLTHGAIPSLLHPFQVIRIDYQPFALHTTSIKEVDIAQVTVGATMGAIAVTLNGVTVSFAFDASATTARTQLRTIPGMEECGVVRSSASDGVGGTLYTWAVFYTGAPLHSPTLTAVGTGGMESGLTFPVSYEAATPTPVAARLYLNGPDVMAEFERDFGPSSSDRLYITYLVRAYDWCRASASTSFGSQSGLSAEAHQAVPVAEWVSLAAQIYAWRRSPLLMEEALEQRRVRALGDTVRDFRAYQDAYLRDVKRDRTLNYDIDGGVLALPFPLRQGDSGAIPESALASTVRRAPTTAAQGGS